MIFSYGDAMDLHNTEYIQPMPGNWFFIICMDLHHHITPLVRASVSGGSYHYSHYNKECIYLPGDSFYGRILNKVHPHPGKKQRMVP